MRPAGKLVAYLSLLLTFVLLFWGGLGIYQNLLYLFAFLVGVGQIIYVWVEKGKIKIPENFYLFILVLVLIALNVFWSEQRVKTVEYLKIFSLGGVFWLTYYNLRNYYVKVFDKYIFFLGIAFAGIFFASLQNGTSPTYILSPFSYKEGYSHLHIGDLWAVVLVVVGLLSLSKIRAWHIFALGLGSYLVILSLSRSAYVSILAGSLFAIYKLQGSKSKRVLEILVLIAVGLIIFAGLRKPTLLVRPYYVQALLGIPKYIFGVGMGNFFKISSGFEGNVWLGFPNVSTMTHNIVLEFFSGLGVLGATFLYWLVKVVKQIISEQVDKGLVYKVAFLALTANFMFDTTYSIPTMLWLWFMLLGLSFDNKKSIKIS